MSKAIVLQDKNGETVYPVGIGTSLQAITDLFYPVGSYYETSDTSFDPNISWYGTWVEDTTGKVTVAYQSGDTNFGTVGQTGGEKTHTLTVQEMPSHKHSYTGFRALDTSTGDGRRQAISYQRFNEDPTRDETFNNTGGDQPHNNLQPYIVVKRWHRTA